MTATLPPLPPEHHHDAEHLYFTAGQMRAYGKACAAAEREACAALCDDVASTAERHHHIADRAAGAIRARKDAA